MTTDGFIDVELFFGLFDDLIPYLITHACHCLECQKITASAFGVNLWIEAKNLKLTGQVAQFTTQGGSGQDHDVHFCQNCSAAIFSRYHAVPKPFLFLRSGSLDDTSIVKPDVHIFMKYCQPGTQIDENLPQFENFYSFKEVWSESSQQRFKQILSTHE